MEKDVVEKRRKMKETLALMNIAEEAEEELEVYGREVDQQKHLKNVHGLNQGQSEVFNMIIQRIEKMETGQVVDSMQLFVSGTAG